MNFCIFSPCLRIFSVDSSKETSSSQRIIPKKKFSLKTNYDSQIFPNEVFYGYPSNQIFLLENKNRCLLAYLRHVTLKNRRDQTFSDLCCLFDLFEGKGKKGLLFEKVHINIYNLLYS